MKRTLLLSAATLLYGTASFAAITAEDLVTAFQGQGYTNIEVKVGATQIKVEASNGPGTGLIEAIYDKETGAILKEETSTDDGDDVDPGVSIEQDGDDFLDDDDDDDDGDDDGDDDDDDDNDDDDDDDGDDGDDDDGDDGDDDDGDDDGDDD